MQKYTSSNNVHYKQKLDTHNGTFDPFMTPDLIDCRHLVMNKKQLCLLTFVYKLS